MVVVKLSATFQKRIDILTGRVLVLKYVILLYESLMSDNLHKNPEKAFAYCIYCYHSFVENCACEHKYSAFIRTLVRSQDKMRTLSIWNGDIKIFNTETARFKAFILTVSLLGIIDRCQC